MIRIPLIVPCAAVLLICSCSSPEPSSTGSAVSRAGERAPTFAAREILPAHKLRGRNYKVDSEVRVVDYDYYFKIKTDYGTIPAHGLKMFDLRLEEMKAISNAEIASRDSQVAKGVVSSIKGTARGAELLLTDPLGAAERAPTGLGRMARSAVDMTDMRSGDASRREIAAKIGCDPETTNPVLKLFLAQLNLRQFAGGELVGMVVPYTDVFDLTADIEQIVRTKPPHVINDELRNELIRLGVDRYVADKFVKNHKFTTMQRLMFMDSYRQLARIDGHATVAEFAMESRSEAEALDTIAAAKAYLDMHRRTPITRFKSIGIPVASLSGGADVIYCVADYLTGTDEVSDAIEAYRSKSPETPCRFVLSGTLSAKAQEMFAAADIRVEKEGGRRR